MGWTYAFSKLCELESFHKSYSSGILPDKISNYNFIEREKWMKGCALEKWESTLNFAFMPMDTMYIFSSKLLLKSIIPLV